MKSNISPTLRRIIEDTKREIESDKIAEPLPKLKRRIPSAKSISFKDRLRGPLGIIAELKEKSPSKGAMNASNVEAAPEAYRDCRIVQAVSVLTNRTHFGSGMTLANMERIKLFTGKPVLRKDFIFDEYQIYQAKHYGADAILLMANILSKKEMRHLFDVAQHLGLDVLFETHNPKEVKEIPDGAEIYGINCRNFSGSFSWSQTISSLSKVFGINTDKTIDKNRFDYIGDLPRRSIKIAESGMSPNDVENVKTLGFNSLLIGTSLLFPATPIRTTLFEFEKALSQVANPVMSRQFAPA